LNLWAGARLAYNEFTERRHSREASNRFYAGHEYVGISGIGIDSVDALAGDKGSKVAKLGVFGYDRMTPFKTIQNGRGLANTVLMIRTPYDTTAGVTPWMAGGGSTVRSIRDKNSLEPFLSPDAKGELGTYVVMCDGSVRYLKKGMSDEVFKAICTVDGPTPPGWRFDDDYPKIEPPIAFAPPPLEGAAIAPIAGTGDNKPKVVAKQKASDMPAGWQEYKHEEGGFTINMPAGGTPFMQQTEKGGMSFTLQGYQVQLAASNALYLALFMKLPGPGDKDDFFRGLKDEFIKPLGATAKVTDEKQITYGGAPGREYALDVQSPKGQAKVFHRVYLVQDRCYTLTALAPDISPNSPEYRAFFESFKVTNP